MASFSRGQLSARHTKIVDKGQCPLKTGSIMGDVCRHDASSSKPDMLGRDGTDDTQTKSMICGSRGCKTCDHLVVGDTFTSNVTKRVYSVVSPSSIVNCSTRNVVYLISCRKCGVQYVGETSQTLRSRFNNHRNRLKQLCGLHLYHHFNSDGHTLSDISIMPIEEVLLEPHEGITLASKRLQREEYWYRELCTVFPYGLNDNVRGLGNVSGKVNEDLVVYALFNKLERKYKRRPALRKKGKVGIGKVSTDVRNILHEYKCLGFTYRIRTYIMSLRKNRLKEVVRIVESLVFEEKLPTRILLLVRDLVTHRFTDKKMRSVIVGHHEKTAENKGYVNVVFHNKGMDMIDLPSILNRKEVVKSIPSCVKDYSPVVSYTYTRTIANRIFNNRRVVEELNFDVGTEDIECNCNSSEYRYEPAGHVVTGDLRIIRDVKLRELIRKGPNYREQNNINWEINVRHCKAAISKYRKKWARKECVDHRVLRDWERTVHECIENKVKQLKSKHINKRKKHVLDTRIHVNYLNQLHKEYVLVPADKAASNVIVVCRKYYLEVIMRELSTTSTYQKVDEDCMDIVMEHVNYLRQSGIDVGEEHEHLPSFYWLPKLHKTPYSSRFIAASNRCTTKQLSSILTSCFKTIISHFKQYCNGICRNTGVNCFWIIENSKEVLDKLHTINRISKAKSFDSYDFSTLYTNIPHAALKSNMKELIKEAYKVRGAKYIIVDTQGKAHWSITPSSVASCMSVDTNKLIKLLEYLIDNVYIGVGNEVFRQTIGIPMGTDCAPQLANLFLFYYEYSYMKNLIRSNLGVAKRFNYTVRYIDDLLTLNNSMFDEEILNIYPPELTLKKTTESVTKVSYLDISISICNGRYSTEVYDKRDSFNFDIINFPHMCSNIPAKPTYGVYVSQIIRIARICDNYCTFIERHHRLTSRLIKQGFWHSRLCRVFTKCVIRHTALFAKYGVSLKTHIQQGICFPTLVRHDLSRNVFIRGQRSNHNTYPRGAPVSVSVA